jgi:TPP-dependent indolepyruvate ferredoxin oxidoreductase alpha subunit
VDINEKKKECFLNGLNDGLAYTLEARDFENFQTMVDKVLVLENSREILSNKLKQECQSQQNNNSRLHIGSSLVRSTFHPVQQSVQRMPQLTGQGFVTPQ